MKAVTFGEWRIEDKGTGPLTIIHCGQEFVSTNNSTLARDMFDYVIKLETHTTMDDANIKILQENGMRAELRIKELQNELDDAESAVRVWRGRTYRAEGKLEAIKYELYSDDFGL